MVYHGRVKNGVIVIDGADRLPEGMSVRIEPVTTSQAPSSTASDHSVWDRLLGLSGCVDGLPSDLAENLDCYLYDAPKS